jgi:hypothetical protein
MPLLYASSMKKYMQKFMGNRPQIPFKKIDVVPCPEALAQGTECPNPRSGNATYITTVWGHFILRTGCNGFASFMVMARIYLKKSFGLVQRNGAA